MMQTKLTKLLGIDYPIIQSGMQWLAVPQLASAVSNAGGIGTINSVSKGRERAPVVQFMGVSRYPLSMSVEEIHHSLLLNYPNFKAEKETEEMIRNFKTLYVENEEARKEFSEYQKSIIVQSTLERYIKKSLERNMFRYGKISERDDDEWYHAIKAASINGSK